MIKNISDIPQEYTRAIETVGTTWSLDDFVRKHGEYEAVVVADSKKGMLEYGIFCDANGKQIVACISDVVKKYSAEEFEQNRPNLEVVVLDSGLYCVCKRWEDVNLDRSPELIDAPKEIHRPSRREERKPNWLNLNEMKKEAVRPYEAIRTSTEVQARTASTRKRKTVCPPIETKPTSSYYLAVVIDMVIAIAVGISVYNSNMIHLEQDRMLFLVMCCVLAIVDWGYPYFDTSVKIDNDGCFEQGCIHPIIGVFGVLFFPLFIHYWMYKGIKTFIGLVKRWTGLL